MKEKGFEYIRHFNDNNGFGDCKNINNNWHCPSRYGQATIGIYIHNDNIYM